MAASILQFDKVSLSYPNQEKSALHDITVHIDEGEFITILGNSGSGKTTLIKLCNKLILPSDGAVSFHGVDVNQLNERELRKQMGYVIQSVGLFPHLTIYENIALIWTIEKRDKSETAARIDELLALMQLPTDAEFKARYPWQLSGGQQQRVGIARALCSDPEVLLMDEPFGALDSVTRIELQKMLKHVQQSKKKTILFVTHDLQEALDLGDRILVMNDGEVQQFDTAKRLVFNPANDYIRNLFNAETQIEKLKYFKVKDFPELIDTSTSHLPEHTVELEDTFDKLLDLLVQGETLVAVHENERALGIIHLNTIKDIR